MFALYCPKACTEMVETLNDLRAHYPDINFPIPGSSYPAVTFNFDGHAVCNDHTDHGNATGVWCHIYTCGNFDHKRGGHIKFPALKLVVEFPSGSSVLIPSATLIHGNTPIAAGEVRYSFVQYCAGGLLRHARYRFRTEKELRELQRAGKCDDWNRIVAEDRGRRAAVMDQFSTVDSLEADRIRCGLQAEPL